MIVRQVAETREQSSDLLQALCHECGEPLAGKFCSRCGAKNRPPLRPLHHWLTDLGRQMAVLDIRLLRTLPGLFFSPGRLTAEYVAGRRLAYTSPIRLYVAASAVVLAAMNLLGISDIETMLAGADEENVAALEEVLEGVADLHDPLFQARFNRSLDTIFPILNLLSPLAIMVLLKLLYWRRYLQEHLAFGCHYGTFLVVVTLLPLLVTGLARSIAMVVVAIASLVYLAVAMRRVYGGGWAGLIARFAALVLGSMAFLLVEGMLAWTIALIAALL